MPVRSRNGKQGARKMKERMAWLHLGCLIQIFMGVLLYFCHPDATKYWMKADISCNDDIFDYVRVADSILVVWYCWFHLLIRWTHFWFLQIYITSCSLMESKRKLWRFTEGTIDPSISPSSVSASMPINYCFKGTGKGKLAPGGKSRFHVGFFLMMSNNLGSDSVAPQELWKSLNEYTGIVGMLVEIMTITLSKASGYYLLRFQGSVENNNHALRISHGILCEYGSLRDQSGHSMDNKIVHCKGYQAIVQGIRALYISIQFIIFLLKGNIQRIILCASSGYVILILSLHGKTKPGNTFQGQAKLNITRINQSECWYFHDIKQNRAGFYGLSLLEVPSCISLIFLV
ncbi:hypothetical protein VP01_1393g4 [Puccinia sorghi]|uniref:Uncharacterized protein n=1 Tax=Puccinia sorghi TaxID=27349 RepID=A0A0L6VLP6_9BASI|nr:hypothetical protein VP01_1393g4 [Puccinia sorghi]